MKILSLLLIIIGLIVFFYGNTMPPYSDHEEFNRKYMALDRDSKAYWELRDEFLTPSFKVQDYGLTLASIGICSIGVLTLLRRSPKNKALLFFVGICAAGSVICAEVGSLFLDFERGEFPHWADSLGIPLSGMPIMGILLGVWAVAHCLFMSGHFSISVNLFSVPIKKWNIWLGILCLATLAIIVLSIIDGYFWHVIPGFLWLYFYLSLNAGRYNNDEQVGVVNPLPATQSE